MKLIMLLMLTIGSYTDIKNRYVDLRLIIGTVLFAVSCMFASAFSIAPDSLDKVLIYSPAPINLVLGMLPGFVMLLICRLSKEKIGEGDALTVMAIGVILGLAKGCIVIMIGFLLAAAVSIFAMYVYKKNKDYTIPFLPFLLASYVLCLISVI